MQSFVPFLNKLFMYLECSSPANPHIDVCTYTRHIHETTISNATFNDENNAKFLVSAEENLAYLDQSPFWLKNKILVSLVMISLLSTTNLEETNY